MPAVRSTVLKLERQIQVEQAGALTALHQSYEQLADALLRLGRERGYLGADPLGALGHLTSATPWDRRLGEAVRELWTTFFACFRPDEAAFEAARFQEKSVGIVQSLEALGASGWPPPELAARMLAALAALWEERHDAISERLDVLIKDLSEHQAKLGNADLQRAHQSDEIGRAMQVLGIALKEIGETIPAGANPSQVLGVLVSRYRRDLAAIRAQVADAAGGRRALVEALDAIASGSDGAAVVVRLAAHEQQVVAGVRRLVDDRRALETQVRELRAQVARQQADQRELLEQTEGQERKLARYELGELARQDGDARLDLYRRAVAAWESGGDPKPLIASVRELEKIVTMSAHDEAQALKILDRQSFEVVKCLHELRGINPLTDDPKRYRPRLLLGSKYDFKRVSGQVQAARDAARDLLEYLARARWTQGVAVLAKEWPRLQKVFREMVDLVAAWREKLGEPPPVSISLDLGSGTSVTALPALLASDLDALLRRKGRAATQALADLAPILEECTALYQRTLDRARGHATTRPEAAKRETAVAAVQRLAGELTTLAGTLDSVFGEAAAAGFVSAAGDHALIEADHLTRLALQQLDAACDVIACLPGAPPTQFTAVPGGRGNGDKLLTCGKQRVAWLEDVATYRFDREG